MKPFYSFLVLLLSSTLAYSQHFNVKDLVEFTALSLNKFDNQITKKDFRRDYYAPQESAFTNNYIQKKKKGDETVRAIAMKSGSGQSIVYYQTSSQAERNDLLQQLKASGFRSYANNSENEEGGMLQNGNLRAYASIEVRDSISLYTFAIERKELPKVRDLQFAEDLLPLSSHEYLCYVFGEGAVKKDVFYYSETETNKCSVLFPNTNRQLIFIWNDEKNYSKTAFILIGGQLQPSSADQNNLSIEHNLWRSRQGIYSGMTLPELQALNGEPINFDSWGQDQEGMLAPKNQGKLDFTKIGLVMNCLNCKDGNYQEAGIVSSESQIEQNKKVYISSIIILPEKEKLATASR
ncbi:MAG TPA: hypothetical protein VD794_03350 [Flavisolibacter sp.]|nr:hypothetical protein [Flavisolibacter sp.]